MADVRINSVESDITVVDSEVLLTPALVDRLMMLLKQRMRDDAQREREAEADRRLHENESR